MLSSDMIAFDYLQRAEEFYQAFKDLRPRPPVNWPRYFVLCHSIELALKAFLLRSGIQPDDLRKHPIRHDIEALIREAEKYSLPLAQSAKDGLILLSRAHAKFWPRYPDASYGDGPVFIADQFEPHVIELLRAVAIAMRGANYKLSVDY